MMEIKIEGIKCDNISCDWRDMSVKMIDYPEWLNKPCPDCGENLLSEEDYLLTLALKDFELCTQHMLAEAKREFKVENCHFSYKDGKLEFKTVQGEEYFVNLMINQL